MCSSLDVEDDPSKPISACWVGSNANCFAVGYDDGSIIIWGIPPSALVRTSGAGCEAVLVASMRVVQDDDTKAAPIRSLSFLEGGPGMPNSEDCLLVRGGQPASDPEMLTLLPLDLESKASRPVTLPWFGDLKAHLITPSFSKIHNEEIASIKRSRQIRRPALSVDTSSSSSIMMLTDGGQLVVHDLEVWQPQPLTFPMQELPPITISKVVPALSSEQASKLQETAIQHSLTLENVYVALRRGSHVPGTLDESKGSHSGAEVWPFTAGKPCAVSPATISQRGCHPSALLFTGHRDGRVRVWDSSLTVPPLVLTVPALDATHGERLKAVSSIDVCCVSGIMAVGYEDGDVRVYQFSDRQQMVRRASLDESLVPYDSMVSQAAGFQYLLRYNGTHASKITSVAVTSGHGLVVVGDASGMVSCLDLALPSRPWSKLTPMHATSEPVIARMAIGMLPEYNAAPQENDGPIVAVTASDCSVTLLSLISGDVLGRIKPKSVSKPLELLLLDSHGIPILPFVSSVILPWADNNSVSATKSVQPVATSSGFSGAAPWNASLTSPSIASSPISRRHSLDVQELPSEDDAELDEALRAAAEAIGEDTSDASMDGQSGRHPRFKLFRRRSSSPAKLSARNKTVSLADEHGLAGRALSSNSQASSWRSRSLPFPEPDHVGGGGPPAIDTAWKATEPKRVVNDKANIDTSADLWGQGERLKASLASIGGQAPSWSLVEADAASTQPIDYRHMRHTIESSMALKAVLKNNCGTYKTSEERKKSSEEILPGEDDERSSSSLGLDRRLAAFEAHFICFVTSDCLRVYSVDLVRQNDRTTERKAKLDPPSLFSAAFLSDSGPGIASVSKEGMFTMHSVPKLSLLYQQSLDDPMALGIPWKVTTKAGDVESASCCSVDGQLFLCNSGNEILRFACLNDTAVPLRPASIYNVSVVKNTSEDEDGNEETASMSSISSNNDGLERSTSQDASSEAQSGVSRFGTSLLASVRGAAIGIADNVNAAGSMIRSEMQNVSRTANPLPPRELPSLRKLFSTPVSSLEIDELSEDVSEIKIERNDKKDSGSLDASSIAPTVAGKAKGLATAALQQGARLKDAMSPGAWRREDPAEALAAEQAETRRKLELAAHERRVELLGRTPPGAVAGGTPSSGGPTRKSSSGRRLVKRTASEVRRVYGHSRAQDARAAIERNRSLLVERGEKLQEINQRAELMASDAEGFADLARELEVSMTKKKWWHLA